MSKDIAKFSIYNTGFKGAILLMMMLGVSGCESLGAVTKLIEEDVPNIADDTINVLDNGIAQISTESSNWRQVLVEMQAQLTDDAQSSVRNELSNLVTRATGVAGVELRCNADFVGDRVLQGLIRIKAKAMGSTVEPTPPAICQVTPVALDKSLVPGRVNKIEFYGYDFDHGPERLKVYVKNSNGSKVNVTNKLDRPTHYAMTLNLGANGVPLTTSSDRIVLEWQNKPMTSLAVIQQQTPVCRTKSERIPASTRVSYVPPHTRGDKDFHGNGPDIVGRVTLKQGADVIRANVYMRAAETKRDWTTASGSRDFDIYKAPSGWQIEKVNLASTKSSYHYVDDGKEQDTFNLGSGGPVKTFTFVGDTKGKEAGGATKVDVLFNQFEVVLKENKNCVSEQEVKTLQTNNMIQPKMLQKFILTSPIKLNINK